MDIVHSIYCTYVDCQGTIAINLFGMQTAKVSNDMLHAANNTALRPNSFARQFSTWKGSELSMRLYAAL